MNNKFYINVAQISSYPRASEINFCYIGIIVYECQHLLRRSVEKFERFQIMTLPVADVVAIATFLAVTVCFPLSRYLFLISWPRSNVE